MTKKLPVKVRQDTSYHLRRLARSGSSRYLSVGKLLPPDWDMVKVFILNMDKERCTIRLEVIK